MKLRAAFIHLAMFFHSPRVMLAVAMLLLACLYCAADWRQVAAALAALDTRYVAAAVAMFVPLTLLSALRWKEMVRNIARITLIEAVRHTLVGSAWNLLLPAKLGDLTKIALLPRQENGEERGSVRAVVVEKIADVAMLLLLIVLGASGGGGRLLTVVLILLGTRAALRERRLRADARSTSAAERPRRLSWSGLLTLSLALWTLHLVQIDLMLKAAGVFVPWSTALARAPLALFAGLVPISFCGIGTRDAALVVLFADVASAPTMAAVGLLTALRYLVPGAVGIALMAAWQKHPAIPELAGGVPPQVSHASQRAAERTTAVSSR